MMKTIAIVAGGDSSEYEVSLRSAQGLYSFIDKEKYLPYIVVLRGKDWQAYPEGLESEARAVIDRNDFSFTYQGNKISFDLAWITIHGTPGENGCLQGYFDVIDMPYQCCGVLAAALTFDKFTCNHYLSQFGIKTAKSVLLKRPGQMKDEEILQACGLPCFVKSNVGGSSFGTTKVKEASQLEGAVAAAFCEGGSVIVESFLDGLELTSGCYKTKQHAVCLPLTEVQTENEFFDYEAKYQGKVEEITPARIPDDLRDQIQAQTSYIYDLLDCRGIIRADYIICKDGIYLLEVNTTPGMTATSFIPQEVRANGQTMAQVMDEIITDIIQ